MTRDGRVDQSSGIWISEFYHWFVGGLQVA